MKDVGYDPLLDLRPIALGGDVPLALVVPANAPYSTLAEFVAFLRTGKPHDVRLRRRRLVGTSGRRAV